VEPSVGSGRRRLVERLRSAQWCTPSLLIFPAIYGVNPRLEPRGNELTRLVDVPLVPMECPGERSTPDHDQVSRLSNYIGGVLLFTRFSTDRGKGRNLHTDARCLRNVACRSAASVQTPEPPGIQVRPAGICCPPWSEAEEMSALRQAQAHTRAARDPAYMGLDQEVEYRNRPSSSLPLISSAS
jgi:hypothetical protein